MRLCCITVCCILFYSILSYCICRVTLTIVDSRKKIKSISGTADQRFVWKVGTYVRDLNHFNLFQFDFVVYCICYFTFIYTDNINDKKKKSMHCIIISNMISY